MPTWFQTFRIVAGLATAVLMSSAMTLDQPSMASAPSDGAPSLSELPKVRVGLWKMTSTIALEGPPRPGLPIEICIDQTLRSRLLERAASRMPSNCHQLSFRRDPDGKIRASTACAGSDGTTQSYKVAISGDFVSTVVVDGDRVITGGAEPGSTTEVRDVFSFVRVGDCLKGEKGGDVMMLKTGGAARGSPP